MSSNTEEVIRADDGTGGGLIQFLNWTIEKDELVEATASALRTGCLKVLEVEDDYQSLDLRSADLDNLVSRFRNRNRYDMKDRTLDAYAKRFLQSVEMYTKWLAGDPTWKPSPRKRAVSSASNGSAPKARSASPVASQSSGSDGVTAPTTQTGTLPPARPGMITYPFPIRPGLQGQIMLPEDLTQREAERVGAFIKTLAFEDEFQPRAALEMSPIPSLED